MPFKPGDAVHVAALGKAVVREVRPRGRYLVELKGRSVFVAENQLSPRESGKSRGPSRPSEPAICPTGTARAEQVRPRRSTSMG